MLYICSNLIICLYNMLFSVAISYNNVHEFTNNSLTLYEIKALSRMKSEYVLYTVQYYVVPIRWPPSDGFIFRSSEVFFFSSSKTRKKGKEMLIKKINASSTKAAGNWRVLRGVNQLTHWRCWEGKKLPRAHCLVPSFTGFK